MIWVACLLKSLDRLICNSITIVVFFRRISTFVNIASHLRKSLISLSKICSRCSMRNSKELIYFRVETTFLFKHSQNNRELRFISSLQSIRSRRLVRARKAQNRKIWINTCLRNQFALFSAKTFLRNRSNYYTKCSMSSTRLFFSFSYFFVFFRFFSLLSHSFRSFSLQKWIVLASINKSF